MTPDAINTLISSVGFPIVACGAMGYFVFYQTKTTNKIVSDLTVAITKLEESVNSMVGEIKDHNMKYEKENE